LGLKGVTLPVGIEIGEERVLFEDFEQQVGVKHRLEQSRQGGFAYSDDALDSDIR
jgi:hypothetical protein